MKLLLSMTNYALADSGAFPDQIDRLKTKTICPGCGTLNPANRVSSDGFSCGTCGWEADMPLPTIGQIVAAGSFTLCTHVNLSAFLRTLLEQEAAND